MELRRILWKDHVSYMKEQDIVFLGGTFKLRYRSPHPIYFKCGKGAYLYDVDGNEYIDMICGNGSIILGHGNEEFSKRFQNYLNEYSGLTTGLETELAVKAAELFLKIFPVDKVRFTISGTEAITHAMHIARAYTGKTILPLLKALITVGTIMLTSVILQT